MANEKSRWLKLCLFKVCEGFKEDKSVMKIMTVHCRIVSVDNSSSFKLNDYY